jgi:putative membrane protein
MHDRRKALILSTLALLGLLAWSGWQPYDRATWLLEIAPVLVALPILWGTYRRFPLTTLLYVCIFLHALVLMLGGAYTYARVPMGFALQDWLDLARNPYDRIGHFFQGFVPAIAAREILVRGKYINGKGMLAFLVICVVMTVSVTYEFIEWGTALAYGEGAVDFLGTQGDPWDTQWDMFMALTGAVTALLLFSRLHDRQIAKLRS